MTEGWRGEGGTERDTEGTLQRGSTSRTNLWLASKNWRPLPLLQFCKWARTKKRKKEGEGEERERARVNQLLSLASLPVRLCPFS